MTTIKNGDELRSLLRKALEVEVGFESVALWEGYVTAKQDEFREVLFSLISDSEGHRRIVESLLDQVRATGSPSHAPVKPREVTFRGNDDLEMMTQISKMEMLMYNLYSDIKKAFVASETESLLNDQSDVESFLSAIDSLIQDEAKHMEMVSQYVRNVERLR
ncbi:MAG: hypothetical protein JSV90_08925 [Methanobacteriota archaeon]|nr:MAG: hypothetical protein JSV90_08925 [Euryarchaeota archaeon]